ncbi:hypothetical protein [Nostoc sp. FACHB-152]|nr:hypothetical protein [Nostoc sp. FACHB-152]
MLKLSKIQVKILNLDGSLDNIAANVQKANSRIQKANFLEY